MLPPTSQKTPDPEVVGCSLLSFATQLGSQDSLCPALTLRTGTGSGPQFHTCIKGGGGSACCLPSGAEVGAKEPGASVLLLGKQTREVKGFAEITQWGRRGDHASPLDQGGMKGRGTLPWPWIQPLHGIDI